MRNGFAHGKGRLVGIELPAEQGAQHVVGRKRRGRLGKRLLEICKALGVMLLEGGDALMRPAEGQPVRRQDQCFFRQLEVGADGVEEPGKRVAFGVDGPDADVGGNLGQQHVARNAHPQVAAVQRRVLRRVPVPDNHLPGTPAYHQAVRIEEPPVADRQRAHDLAVEMPALGEFRVVRAVQAVGLVERHGGLGRVTGIAVHRRMGGEVFALRHPHLAAEALDQPAGVARMVRVVVRDDQAVHGLVADMGGKNLFPRLARCLVRQPAIDDGVARHTVQFVVEQPQVDVVQGEGQRHTQPAHPGGDFDGRAGRGRFGVREL